MATFRELVVHLATFQVLDEDILYQKVSCRLTLGDRYGYLSFVSAESCPRFCRQVDIEFKTLVMG